MSETYEEPLDPNTFEDAAAPESEADPATELDDEPDDDFEAHLFNRR